VQVIFEGTTTFEFFSGSRGSYGGDSKPKWYLMSISGDDVTVKGAPGNSLDGQGQLYWDGTGSNKGNFKPKFVRFSLTNSVVEGLNFKNTPIHAFSVDACSKVHFNDIHLDNGNGQGKGGKGHNTDAFDIHGSHDITISKPVVHNQDDCLAVNSGSNIKFHGAMCDGGHGISIGSIKSGSKVDGVDISDCTVKNSENGVRIKTWSGESGASVKGVSYTNIILQGITDKGVVVRQDYKNGGPTNKPATGGITISGLKLKNIKGDAKQSVYINCVPGMCTGWTVEGINVTGGKATCISPPANAKSALKCG
jgi:polygalacturonase